MEDTGTKRAPIPEAAEEREEIRMPRFHVVELRMALNKQREQAIRCKALLATYLIEEITYAGFTQYREDELD